MILIAGVSELIRLLEEHHGWVEEEEEEWEETSGGRGSGGRVFVGFSVNDGHSGWGSDGVGIAVSAGMLYHVIYA